MNKTIIFLLLSMNLSVESAEKKESKDYKRIYNTLKKADLLVPFGEWSTVRIMALFADDKDDADEAWDHMKSIYKEAAMISKKK